MSKKVIEEGTSRAGVTDLRENDLEQVYGGAIRAYWEARRAKEQGTSTKGTPASNGGTEYDLGGDFSP